MKNRMDIQYESSAQMRDEFSRSHKGQLLVKQRHCKHLHQMQHSSIEVPIFQMLDMTQQNEITLHYAMSI